MNPHDLVNSVKDSRVGQSAQSAHDAVDRIYQALVRPDRPVEPEIDKKPWLAAFWSVLLTGAGQFYNRQLGKALWLLLLTYGVGGVLLLSWLLLQWAGGWADPEGWVHPVVQFFVRLGWAVPVVSGGLWLFGIVDAWRTAAALRRGDLVVRYSFMKQTACLAAGFIPVAGALAPQETCAPDEVQKKVGSVVRDHAIEKLAYWMMKRTLKVGFLVLGLLPLLVGAAFDWPVLIVFGALAILAGLIFIMS
ncbi:MAG: hypothetical protein JNM56_31485 [Planctomycetia bacterium]|nr:hypothetical protein [Planctomycetia bacterium]